MDSLFDWLNDWRNAVVLFFFIIISSSLFMLLISEQPVAAPETQVVVELPEPKPILKSISWVYDNQNVTYLPAVFSITNEQNYTVQLRMDFFSEPEALMEYMVFSVTPSNGTLFLPNNSLVVTVSVETFTNPKNITGDYYLTVYGEPL